jgi:hypothetical protein
MKASEYLQQLGYTNDTENNCFDKLDKRFIDKEELKIKIKEFIKIEREYFRTLDIDRTMIESQLKFEINKTLDNLEYMFLVEKGDEE